MYNSSSSLSLKTHRERWRQLVRQTTRHTNNKSLEDTGREIMMSVQLNHLQECFFLISKHCVHKPQQTSLPDTTWYSNMIYFYSNQPLPLDWISPPILKLHLPKKFAPISSDWLWLCWISQLFYFLVWTDNRLEQWLHPNMHTSLYIV